MRSFLRILILFLFSLSAWAEKGSPADITADPEWVQAELKKMKLPKAFIDMAMKSYQKDRMESVLKLNLLGFLQPPQHMDHVTKKAVNEAIKFRKKHGTAFTQAKKQFNIPPEVISALIWIETRHGDLTGSYHVVSVYLSLLQTDRPSIRRKLTALAVAKNKEVQRFEKDELRKLMKERTKQKAKWAREEIRALAVIHKKKQLDLKKLKGSFAGAFGLPQFIPSSYKAYAKSHKVSKPADLYKPADAIMSVANYLKKSGWKDKKPNSHVKALMKYNNSRDYADSILEIAKRAAEKDGRGLASKK